MKGNYCMRIGERTKKLQLLMQIGSLVPSRNHSHLNFYLTADFSLSISFSGCLVLLLRYHKSSSSEDDSLKRQRVLEYQ